MVASPDVHHHVMLTHGDAWLMVLYFLLGTVALVPAMYLVRPLPLLAPAILIATFVLGLCAVGIGLHASETAIRAAIIRDGVPSRGAVANLHTEMIDDGVAGADPHYFCDYTFSVDGHDVQVQAEVDPDVFARLTVGQPLDVYYLRDDPSHNQPVQTLPLTPPDEQFATAMLLAITAGVLYLGTVAAALIVRAVRHVQLTR